MKLHLVINHRCGIITWMLTPGNVDDRKPVPKPVQDLFGKVYGDRGYISQNLFEELYEKGVQLITRIRANMKNVLMDTYDRLVLAKRGVIESVNMKLNLECQIEHHRHRSVLNFMTNLLAGLVSYSFDPHKPEIKPLHLKNCFG
jgi:hypothetical protein